MTGSGSDHDPLHGGWLVPVHRDRDGTWLIVCYVDREIGTPVDGLALYCPACRATVTSLVAGTEGLSDLDGLTDALADGLLRQEHRLAQAHAALMTVQPEQPYTRV